MLDAILAGLNALRESQLWPLFKGIGILFFFFPWGAAVSRKVLYDRAQVALRRAGISNTAAAINAGIGESLASKKLRGEGDKTLSLDFLLAQGDETLQWFALELIDLVGLPPVAVTATKVDAFAKSHPETQKVGAA